MASVLLAAATAGVLLPLAAAAGAQTDANRRVIAVRFAADVVERIAAMEYAAISCPDDYIKTAAELNYTESVYERLSVRITTSSVDISGVQLILLTVEVFDNNRPKTALRTLIGNESKI